MQITNLQAGVDALRVEVEQGRLPVFVAQRMLVAWERLAAETGDDDATARYCAVARTKIRRDPPRDAHRWGGDEEREASCWAPTFLQMRRSMLPERPL